MDTWLYRRINRLGARPATRLFELVLDRIGRLPGVSLITGRREAGGRRSA